MDKGARITGLLTFVVGLALMAIVFVSASRLLTAKSTPPAEASAVAHELYLLVARILALFVMGYIASAVSGRGIQMYQAACGKPQGDRQETA